MIEQFPRTVLFNDQNTSVVDVYFRSLIPLRHNNLTKYGNPAKLLFIINANLATFKITVGGIRDAKIYINRN